MIPTNKKKKPVRKRSTIKNVGAYSHPFSGVGVEHAPLHAATIYERIVVHECGYLPECTGWNFHSVYSPFWRLYYNSKSGHSLTAGDNRLHLRPDRLVLVPPHCIFDCEGVSPVPHFWTHFTYNRSLGDNPSAPLELLASELELSLIRELVCLCDGERPSSSDENLFLGLALLHVVLCRKEITWKAYHPPSLQKAIEYIDLHFQSNLKIVAIAKIAGLSESGLTRVFKKHLGLSSAHYVLDCRIREATSLLQHTQETIDSIAEKTGFTNRFYFTRMFKKTTGHSPAEFRKEHALRYSAT